MALPSCRYYGDFWNRKPGQDAGGGGLLPNQVHPVSFTPGAGNYNATQNVALASVTAGATICYTTDGTAPACNAGICTAGTTYSSAISVATDQTIRALACKAEMINAPEASAAYIIDTTPPVISGVAPTSSSYALNTQVSYTLSENCASASITWTRTGGAADAGSPHVRALVGSELTAGTHNNITITNNPTLVDGAIYSVQFDCTDAASNAASPVTSTNVTYDFNDPVISATAPISGAFRNTTHVSYTLSENCASGSITWTRTGGATDAGSPHAQALVGTELNAGVHNNIILTNNPLLVSGAIYTVAFNCTDAAGRNATTVTSTSVTFDNVVPVISGVAPASSSYVNTTAVSYTLSEDCASASITWTRTGGAADGASPHAKALTGSELTAGTKTNIIITDNPTLVDGAVYSIAFNCTDAAGNSASTVTRTGVTFDPSAVVISGVAPSSNSFRNNTQVSYTLSEDCASASITWTRTGGAADGASPHVRALVGSELTAGTKTNITITNNPTLVDGAIYSVQFDCTDFASNNSTPVTVNNVTYDFTNPVISGVAPATGAHRNHTQVSYTLSENCATAQITWNRTGGAADLGSPHVRALVGSELTAGTKTDITITNNPTLVSGTVYSVTFECSDAAGNVATPVTSNNFTYDTTAPTISIQNVRHQGTVHSGFVIGNASDNVGVTLVKYNLDSSTWVSATYSAPNWKFPLPTGTSTWRDRTSHTIQVLATDAAGNTTASSTITVRKGNNRDINGDGYGDVVVGAFKYNSYQGRAYIFYGSGAGISATSAASADRIITGETGTTRFGRNSALGDFNGDGFADLAVSATLYNTNQGRAYIFYGSVSGISIMAAGSADRIITGAAGEQFSSPLIAADVNADGYSDLLAGANAYSSSLGRAFLFHGSSTGITATATSGANATFTGEALSGEASSSLAVGDFDNDNRADIIMGAPAVSINQGRAYAIYGTATPFSGNTTVANTTNTIITGGIDHFMGGSSAVGDFNGDGATDLALGGYGTASASSLMRVFYGTTGTQNFSGDSAPIQTTVTESNVGYFLTTGITSGDLNADGKDELCVGAHGGTLGHGYVAVFFGSSTPLSATLPSHAGYLRSGSGLTSAGTQFARGLGISDVNGDGYPDLLVGANFVATDTGNVFIFHSSSSGPTSTPNTSINGVSGSEFGVSFAR